MPNTQDLQTLISWHFLTSFCYHDCSPRFPEGLNVQTLYVDWLPDAHGSISCLRDFSTAELPFSHILVSESEALFKLGDGLFPDFVSSTSNVVDGHSNDTMVSLLWTSQDQNSRF